MEQTLTPGTIKKLPEKQYNKCPELIKLEKAYET